MIDFGHGINLQRIEPADLPQMLKWRNDNRIWQWCRQYDLISKTAHERWFERQELDPKINMYKVMTPVGGFVGVCGLTDIDPINRRAEFSLYLGPEHHGKGLGKACLQTLFTHGFKNLGLNSIWGETFDGNPAAALFQKIGMKRDGIRREAYFRNGWFVDAILFSVMAREWT